MQTTAIRTVAKSLPQNKVILLTCLISNSYIPYTDLRKICVTIEKKHEKIKKRRMKSGEIMRRILYSLKSRVTV